jgi:hypothetical protein
MQGWQRGGFPRDQPLLKCMFSRLYGMLNQLNLKCGNCIINLIPQIKIEIRFNFCAFPVTVQTLATESSFASIFTSLKNKVTNFIFRK